MGTVSGLTAERLSELMLSWELVKDSHDELAGNVNQMSSSLDILEQSQLDLTNNHIPLLHQGIQDTQITLGDVTENQLPELTEALAGVEGLFPITETSIEDGAISTPKLQANSITGEKFVASVSIVSKEIFGGSIVGTRFATSSTGTRLEINDDDEAGSIKGWFDDFGTLAPVLINPKILNTGLSRCQVLYLSSGSMGGGVARIEIRSGSLDGGTSSPPLIYVDAELHAHGVLRAFGNIRVAETQTLIYEGYIDEGASDGAKFNNSGALIRVDTSSRVYKQDITPLTLEEAQASLAMEPVSFVWKPDMDLGDDRHAGFIVEQVAGTAAQILLNKDVNQVPRGFRYSELPVLHHVLLQDQQRRIERLEALVRKLLPNSQNGSES